MEEGDEDKSRERRKKKKKHHPGVTAAESNLSTILGA